MRLICHAMFLFQLLSLCHIIHGHQLYINPVHLVVIGLILAACCVLSWAVNKFWQAEWTLLYLSLLVSVLKGPLRYDAKSRSSGVPTRLLGKKLF